MLLRFCILIYRACFSLEVTRHNAYLNIVLLGSDLGVTPLHAFDVFLHLATFRPASRPAASSTSSASYPESRAACTTCVSCAARGCGTAGTSPPWNVLVNILTRRAAPMEAPPPPSPPRPPRPPHPRPHRNLPPRLHRWARKAPKPGIFSLSGNSPEVEAVGGREGGGLLGLTHVRGHLLDS